LAFFFPFSGTGPADIRYAVSFNTPLRNYWKLRYQLEKLFSFSGDDICMDLSGVTALTKNQATKGQSANQSSQDTGGNTGGWKYVTVQSGDIIYTYIVIGKNMKVLVGQTSAKKNDDNDPKTAADKNTAAGSQDKPAAAVDSAAAANSAKPTAAKERGGNTKETAGPDFFSDLRMFALTGYYQQKMRETIKNMKENIVTDKVTDVKASANAGKKPDESELQ